jgi:hypothetical protein
MGNSRTIAYDMITHPLCNPPLLSMRFLRNTTSELVVFGQALSEMGRQQVCFPAKNVRECEENASSQRESENQVFSLIQSQGLFVQIHCQTEKSQKKSPLIQFPDDRTLCVSHAEWEWCLEFLFLGVIEVKSVSISVPVDGNDSLNEWSKVVSGYVGPSMIDVFFDRQQKWRRLPTANQISPEKS